MARVVSRTVRTQEIDELTARRMYRLFEQYYVEVSYEQFLADLREKTHCFVFSFPEGGDGPGRIVGFSTAVRTALEGQGRATFLFSGDTVVDAEFWGERLLHRAFFWFILRTKLRSPLRRVYWMLISKGFPTYLMMVHHFPRSFPRRDASTPPELGRAMAAYYQVRYGDAFDAGRGIIAFPESHGAVRGRMADPVGPALDDPDVRFFLERNPRYGAGEELACIAEIRWRDFLRHLAVFRRGRRRPVRGETVPSSAAARR